MSETTKPKQTTRRPARKPAERKTALDKAVERLTETPDDVRVEKRTEKPVGRGGGGAKLKIIPLGGLNEIGKNLTVFEYGDDIIVIDCGLGFPDDDMYGVDIVIPDFSYLVKNQSRIRGIFLTHGHEDHIGAVPYLLKNITAPVYGTRLTLALIKLKLQEHGLLQRTKLITMEAGQSQKAGVFKVEAIHLNHSIADAVAFAIKTPIGTVVHMGDFKIDPTPIHGEMTDLARLGQLGKEGVLALLSDSTNVEKPGYSTSESMIGESFDRLFNGCTKRIIVTTFASNVHRLQQVINVAAKYGRKVGITGRSMENIINVSMELGYLKVPKNILMPLDQLKNLPRSKQVIITTGSQGEDRSALYRMAFSGHKQVEIGPEDRVIISASAVPGNERTVSNVINELFYKGADVIYDKFSNLHVSGHACQEELKMILALVRPQFFIPVHGEHRMLKKHADIAVSMGMPQKNTVIAEIGNVIELTKKSAKINGTVPAGKVLVDGTGVGDVGSVVLRDRKVLAEDGMVVVVMNLSAEDGSLASGPDIITRGFIYVKESEELMKDLRRIAIEALAHSGGVGKGGRIDYGAIRSAVKQDMSGFLYKKTRRSPMILPVIMEI
ncbi:MAG: ribonuclease J [Oscillospiraceae bacterium]|nr:ribonuclease J [Oscillospiraceae bacterium]